MTFQREIYLRDINVAEHFRGHFIQYNRQAGHRHLSLVLRDNHSEYMVAVRRQATLSRRQGCVAEYPAFSS